MNLHWLKLDINILDDSKIKFIRKLPDGNNILVLWIGILCMGMKSGKAGVLEIGDGIPFDAEMLSTEFDLPLNTVKMGISTFVKMKMLENWDGTFYITNFEKHQQLEKIEKAKQISRESSQKYREKMKQLTDESDGHVTKSDDTEKIRIDKKREDKKPKEPALFFGSEKNVKLTQTEYDKLISIYGNLIIKKYIDSLSFYLLNNPNKYKSHYATLRTWLNRDGIKPKKPDIIIKSQTQKDIEAVLSDPDFDPLKGLNDFKNKRIE